MTTYCAAFLRPGTSWNPDKTVREQPFWNEHTRFMDSLFEQGTIILAGPFADRSGSMVNVAADNAGGFATYSEATPGRNKTFWSSSCSPYFTTPCFFKNSPSAAFTSFVFSMNRKCPTPSNSR
jgi:hypothetical protein